MCQTFADMGITYWINVKFPNSLNQQGFMYLVCYVFWIRPLLDARAEIQKYFRSFFGANENFQICFQDLLTFRFSTNRLHWPSSAAAPSSSSSRTEHSNYIVPNINNSRHSRGKWYRWLCLIFLQLPSRRWRLRLRCTEVLDDVALCTSLANRARHIVGILSFPFQTGMFVYFFVRRRQWPVCNKAATAY